MSIRMPYGAAEILVPKRPYPGLTTTGRKSMVSSTIGLDQSPATTSRGMNEKR